MLTNVINRVQECLKEWQDKDIISLGIESEKIATQCMLSCLFGQTNFEKTFPFEMYDGTIVQCKLIAFMKKTQ